MSLTVIIQETPCVMFVIMDQSNAKLTERTPFVLVISRTSFYILFYILSNTGKLLVHIIVVLPFWLFT